MLGVAVSLLVVSGCGDPAAVSASSQSERRSQGDIEVVTDAGAAVRDAAGRSAEQATIQTRVTMSVDGEEISRTTMAGPADGATGRGTTSMQPFGEISFLYTGEAYYFAYPNLPPGKEWVRMGLDELTARTGLDPSAAVGQDPTTAFELLEQASEGVETLGRKEVSGVGTTHYRFTADVATLMERAVASGVLSGDAAEAGDMFDGSTQADVWIDDDGLVRRMSYELSVDPGAAAGMPSTFGYEFEFSDYGAPVDLSPPPPETTISLMDLMAEGS